jgi:hypothetical protein
VPRQRTRRAAVVIHIHAELMVKMHPAAQRHLVSATRAGAVPLLQLRGRQRRLPAPFRRWEEGPHGRAHWPLRGVNDERERRRAAAAPVWRRVHAPTARRGRGWAGARKLSGRLRSCGLRRLDDFERGGGLISASRAPCGPNRRRSSGRATKQTTKHQHRAERSRERIGCMGFRRRAASHAGLGGNIGGGCGARDPLELGGCGAGGDRPMWRGPGAKRSSCAGLHEAASGRVGGRERWLLTRSLERTMTHRPRLRIWKPTATPKAEAERRKPRQASATSSSSNGEASLPAAAPQVDAVLPARCPGSLHLTRRKC